MASKDNTLYQSGSGALSNGAGESLFVGRTNSGQVRRLVVAFDLASAVPAGAKVTSVRLVMNMSKSQADGTTVQLHRISASWGEGTSRAGGEQGGGGSAAPGDATWVHRSFDTQKWSREGGDFAEAASASVVVGLLGKYTWGSTPQMVVDAQAWVDDPARNFGWILIGDENNTQTTKRFDSREAAAAAQRPTLTIGFVAR
ncbi:MAG: DNRLRE domain-containing protein [Chloroflexi bacterium]|nr:DNRLRE domain-containing protein [Chloroflexota bacterium]